MQLLLIDNYDSFTYNLLHLVREVCESADRIVVVPNDRISAMEVGDYDRILLSPGPGVPSEAGTLLDVVRTAAGRIPILGVCLGHQAIAEAFGAELCNLEHPLHGVRSRVGSTLLPGYSGGCLRRSLSGVIIRGWWTERPCRPI